MKLVSKILLLATILVISGCSNSDGKDVMSPDDREELATMMQKHFELMEKESENEDQDGR